MIIPENHTTFKLSQKQISSLTGGKHWSEKKQHLLKLIRNYNIRIEEQHLQWFMEVFIDQEIKGHKREFLEKSKAGIIKNHLTPTDVKGDFTLITNPVIGVKYHISWAYSGAVFKLVRVENDICYLDNPKYKRKELIKCKVSELRGLRQK